MSRLMLAGLVFILTSSMALPCYAQGALSSGRTPELLNEEASNALIERRLDLVKSALALTPAQVQYWPAVDQAIRARIQARHQRLARLAAQLNDHTQLSPIELMNRRADALSARSAALKNLADAWKPLYESLDPAQKVRLRVLAVYVLREMRDAVEARRMQFEDHEGEDEDEY